MVTPIFTPRGVCYTSQITEVAYSASEFYGVEIWVTANRAGFEYPSNKKAHKSITKSLMPLLFHFYCFLDLSSEFINFKLLFNGIYYVLTDPTELPVVALIQDSKIVQPAEHHWLKLETNVVKEGNFDIQ